MQRNVEIVGFTIHTSYIAKPKFFQQGGITESTISFISAGMLIRPAGTLPLGSTLYWIVLAQFYHC